MIQGFPKKKERYCKKGIYNTGRNDAIDECESAVMKKLDKEKIEKLLKDMCFDLVSKGEIAQAIVDYMKGGV